MGKVIVTNGITLDGVMQGPGRPDEDTRDGFAYGGWGVRYYDQAAVAKMGERMGEERAFLFGRHTYEQLMSSWNARGGPFKDALNDTPKFVASSNSATQLDLMAADVIDEYLLMIAPLVLCSGRRLFPDGVRAPLRLTECVATGTGTLLATHEPERTER